MKKQHHAFLLLELMVALLLIVTCILPFTHIPTKAATEELLFMQRLELQHLSDRTCALVQERIYTKEIPWEKLCSDKKELIIDDIVSIPIKELAKHRYARKCYLLKSQGKKGQNKEEYRLVKLCVVFEKSPHTLKLFSNRKSRTKMQFTYQFFIKQEKVKV